MFYIIIPCYASSYLRGSIIEYLMQIIMQLHQSCSKFIEITRSNCMRFNNYIAFKASPNWNPFVPLLHRNPLQTYVCQAHKTVKTMSIAQNIKSVTHTDYVLFPLFHCCCLRYLATGTGYTPWCTRRIVYVLTSMPFHLIRKNMLVVPAALHPCKS